MSPRRVDPVARAHQHRRMVSAWLSGEADPDDAGDLSPRWWLAGLAAGVLTVAAWGAVGLLDHSSGGGPGDEPATVAGRCD